MAELDIRLYPKKHPCDNCGKLDSCDKPDECNPLKEYCENLVEFSMTEEEAKERMFRAMYDQNTGAPMDYVEELAKRAFDGLVGRVK